VDLPGQPDPVCFSPRAIDDPILITGAGGFIGSHLAELCVERGHRVRAFVHYNSLGRWGWLDDSPYRDAMEIVAGDVRDFDSVYRALEGCPTVFHLAALIGIPYSYVSPLAYLRTNIEGTYNVLEAARLHEVQRVLITSTSETYGTAQRVPINEEHPSVGQSPYAASKIAADQVALSYYRSFGLPVRVVRPFNTYGPRQSARAFIPNVIVQILAGQRRLRVGNLAPTRDLTFVKDTAAGFLAIAGAEGLDGTATNIGTGREISMGDLLQKTARLLGADVDVEVDRQRVRPEDSEVERLLCDNTRLRRCTGWAPAYDLETGLQETIHWVREHLDAFKPTVYNI
jgi:dTDP-glucose 4,6-dehydratase